MHVVRFKEKKKNLELQFLNFGLTQSLDKHERKIQELDESNKRYKTSHVLKDE